MPDNNQPEQRNSQSSQQQVEQSTGEAAVMDDNSRMKGGAANAPQIDEDLGGGAGDGLDRSNDTSSRASTGI